MQYSIESVITRKNKQKKKELKKKYTLRKIFHLENLDAWTSLSRSRTLVRLDGAHQVPPNNKQGHARWPTCLL